MRELSIKCILSSFCLLKSSLCLCLVQEVLSLGSCMLQVAIKYLFISIVLFLSIDQEIDVDYNIWNSTCNQILSVIYCTTCCKQLISCRALNLLNILFFFKKVPFSSCLPACVLIMDKDATFAWRLSHDYEVACCWWTVLLLCCCCSRTLEKCLLV